MQLRFVEDRRAIFWAFVLFPLVPALAYARPALLPWLVPLLFYTSYCSGVLTHNHVHCPTFVGRRWNVAYGAWLSLFYGFLIFSWVPTHNQNHHRYLDGDGDATQTTRLTPKDTLLGLLAYPLKSGAAQLAGIAAYVRDARRRPQRLARIAGLDAAQVTRWLESPPPAGPLHRVPSSIDAPRAFGTAFRQGAIARLSWSLLAIAAVVPALIVAALGPFGPVPRAVGIALAALAGVVAWVVCWAVATSASRATVTSGSAVCHTRRSSCARLSPARSSVPAS